MRFVVIFALALTACTEWPDAGGAPLTATRGPFPTLLPVADLLTSGTEAEGEDADQLSARAAALRGRAAILRRSAGNQAEIDALRARLRP